MNASRQTGAPGSNAAITSFDGSRRPTETNRVVSVLCPLALTIATPRRISSALSGSRGCADPGPRLISSWLYWPDASLAAGLSAGWNTPSTRSEAEPVFSRQCGRPGGRCRHVPGESGCSRAADVRGPLAREDQHDLVVGVAVLGCPPRRDLADELGGDRAAAAGPEQDPELPVARRSRSRSRRSRWLCSAWPRVRARLRRRRLPAARRCPAADRSRLVGLHPEVAARRDQQAAVGR